MKNIILSLTCRNIGVFNNLAIEFSPRFNLLIGPNGTGKTSILKLICLALYFPSYNKIRLRKDADLLVKSTVNDQIVNYGGTNISDIDQALNNFKWSQGTQSLPNRVNEKNVNWGETNPGCKLFAIGAHRYFSYNQIKGMVREEKSSARLQTYLENNFNYLDNPILPDIKQWMINRYFIIEKDWAKIERENWNYILASLPDLSPQNTTLEFVKIEKDLEPIFQVNGRECYLEELSSGFKSVLSIVFSIVDWIEAVNENDDAFIKNATGTVLIDEIDVHLHPQWQQVIINLVKGLFPNLQFIATAHSPLVVASADVNEVIILPENQGDVTLRPEKENFNLWTTEDIMSQLMGYESRDEGSTKFNQLLDYLDVFIIEGNLAKFEEMLKELKKSVSPTDPILKIYEIKRTKLYMNQNDKNLPS